MQNAVTVEIIDSDVTQPDCDVNGTPQIVVSDISGVQGSYRNLQTFKTLPGFVGRRAASLPKRLAGSTSVRCRREGLQFGRISCLPTNVPGAVEGDLPRLDLVVSPRHRIAHR
ncbi:MAG: hypothetical protein AAF317_00225 [Pseudomonadota bacterium]